MRNHFLRAAGVPSSGGGGSSIIDTDLYVHYDFSDTNCWNRNNSTNAADYTVNNLANDYNDAVFRCRDGSGTSYQNSSASPVIDFDSSDGGGCLEVIPTNNTANDDDCLLAIPGTTTSTSGSNRANNLSTVTGTNNLYNGIGTGAYTFELWYRVYLNYGNSPGVNYNGNIGYPLRIYYKHSASGLSGIEEHLTLRITDMANPMDYSGEVNNYNANIRYSISGVPSSGAAWSNWNHLVYSRNSSSTNDTKVYVNNSLDETQTDSKDYDELRYLYFFPYSNVLRNPLKYGIFRFYRGKALTSSEVTTNWNAQKSRFGH